MNSAVIIRTAEFARDIYNKKTLSINPFAISDKLGIEIISDKPMKKDGYLICSDGLKLIFVSSNITNLHRKRFVIAHELGHFFLHRDKLYSCENVSEVNVIKANSFQQEQEANLFASELLLPNDKLKLFLPKESLKFNDISFIANKFNVSMTFAAIKCVKNSNTESEMLLCYKGRRLLWYITPETQYISPNLVPQICPIDPNSDSKMHRITGVWNDLYTGTVTQGFFTPFKDFTLILLSGQRATNYYALT